MLAAGVAADADPQLLVHTAQPLVHHTSPLISSLTYSAPVVYKTAEKTVETADVKKIETPLVYTHQPLAYTHPLTYTHYPLTHPLVYKAAEKVEKKEGEEVPAKTLIYSAPTAYYNTHPVAYHTPAVAYEAVPQYVAKNGEVEHKVYKRDAEADADPQLFFNTYGYLPTATSYKYVSAPAATTTYTYARQPAVTYSAPSTYAYGSYAAPIYQPQYVF